MEQNYTNVFNNTINNILCNNSNIECNQTEHLHNITQKISSIELNSNNNENTMKKRNKKHNKKHNKKFDYDHIQKIYKSASITFVDDFSRCLMCEEFRYKEQQILLHTIGGKVENYDADIFETGIREFIEEADLESHPIINSNNYDKKNLIKYLYAELKNISMSFDVKVGKNQYSFHKFYVIKLSSLNIPSLKKSFEELPDYFNHNKKTEINKIMWLSNNNSNKKKICNPPRKQKQNKNKTQKIISSKTNNESNIVVETKSDEKLDIGNETYINNTNNEKLTNVLLDINNNSEFIIEIPSNIKSNKTNELIISNEHNDKNDIDLSNTNIELMNKNSFDISESDIKPSWLLKMFFNLMEKKYR